jgi:hypothetical protein
MATIQVKLKVGHAVLEIEADDPKQLFRRMAACADLLVESKCGCCGSEAIVPEVRKAGDSGEYEYFAWRCSACRAQMDFGQNKDGKRLFAKRSEHPDTGGWYVWEGGGGGGGSSAGRQERGGGGGVDEDIPF